MLYGDLLIIDIEKKEGVNNEPENSPYKDLPLPKWYRSVKNKRISDLSDFDISRFIRQDMFLKYIVPEALKRLKKNPFSGEMYLGEMLVAVYQINIQFWIDNREILKTVQELLEKLNNTEQLKAEHTEIFEELTEHEHKLIFGELRAFSEDIKSIE